jgi:hypothetical protein
VQVLGGRARCVQVERVNVGRGSDLLCWESVVVVLRARDEHVGGA